jgi:hypothetical protein
MSAMYGYIHFERATAFVDSRGGSWSTYFQGNDDHRNS